VTLSARVLTPNLATAGAGVTTGAITTGAGIGANGAAVRGSLTSVTSPRAVLSILNAGPSPWN